MSTYELENKQLLAKVIVDISYGEYTPLTHIKGKTLIQDISDCSLNNCGTNCNGEELKEFIKNNNKLKASVKQEIITLYVPKYNYLFKPINDLSAISLADATNGFKKYIGTTDSGLSKKFIIQNAKNLVTSKENMEKFINLSGVRDHFMLNRERETAANNNEILKKNSKDIIKTIFLNNKMPIILNNESYKVKDTSNIILNNNIQCFNDKSRVQTRAKTDFIKNIVLENEKKNRSEILTKYQKKIKKIEEEDNISDIVQEEKDNTKIKRDQDLEKNRVIFQVVNILLKNFNNDSWEGVQDNLKELGYSKDTTLNISQLKPIVFNKLQEKNARIVAKIKNNTNITKLFPQSINIFKTSNDWDMINEIFPEFETDVSKTLLDIFKEYQKKNKEQGPDPIKCEIYLQIYNPRRKCTLIEPRTLIQIQKKIPPKTIRQHVEHLKKTIKKYKASCKKSQEQNIDSLSQKDKNLIKSCKELCKDASNNFATENAKEPIYPDWCLGCYNTLSCMYSSTSDPTMKEISENIKSWTHKKPLNSKQEEENPFTLLMGAPPRKGIEYPPLIITSGGHRKTRVKKRESRKKNKKKRKTKVKRKRHTRKLN
tara:strand:- start:5276 stop:7069 length:1794 start_codon:yes stop_codon:yes gene_type:complete